MDNEYSTKDFTTAVVLKLEGYELTNMTRSNRVTTFYFASDNEEDIKETLDLYWSGDLVAPVREVLETEKELKTRIYTLP